MPFVQVHALTNLSAIRRAIGYSQAELARRAGFDQSYVSRLERGLVPSDVAHAERLAGVLGVAVNLLFAHRIQINVTSPSGAVTVNAVTAE
jgi:transcriptional regulator with XRE-family HTH domain